MNQLTIIGTIHSQLKNLEDCPRQEDEAAPGATLVIAPEFSEGIKDIQAGDDLLLFTWLHRADRKVIACQPRNDPHAPLTGVFSTRSPDRPNPIGIHYVKVVEIEGASIRVSNLEVLDQTPVIDIKPVWNMMTRHGQ
ncbi:MAG TPA: tRNA (N6-threonylcarbamoyladenosine(37)-N6)-methyltransferase TrmO [Ohtaekwangia sp.]|nr:tRNA (N6-threonylcarbamoyladenosine(37)-N6)-methyltransferase TrmO [Ohtaekwangia sp.]